MQIYFVRHGKTQWNQAQIFQGAHGDSSLLLQSLIDIKKLGNYLKGTDFSAIYTSPLKRAVTTAKGLQQELETNLIIKTDERLREFDLGKLEGLHFSNALAKYPEQVNNLWHHPQNYDGKSIGGENYSDVIKRGKNFTQEIVQKYPKKDQKVLVISHGAALAAILGGLLGYSLNNLRQHGGLSNTSLTILETIDQGKNFHLIVWNETSFLERKLVDSDSL
ncbi:histidine phosphatase family protein [Lactobacillus sp. ESL0228]|uniref:histidine phosphatase family protein n=1 Tax=Lactobacillus sp. ESL0228 TaxID=2069352 RepID=UPI000EFCDA62|nr:histidine phosphatase family protein [Lactobacillus sp. ESL0228]RMC48711.1 histidine phosphatase family protein [Lactobacillus sp. ESL0228]